MDASLRRQTLSDTLRRSAQRVPNRLGLACGATRWSYAELHGASERLAAGLASRGIGRGDKVAVLARNSHGFVALRYALMRLGAIMVPINFMLHADDVAFILNHSGARMLACDSGMAEVGREGRRARAPCRRTPLAAVGGGERPGRRHDESPRAHRGGRRAAGRRAGELRRRADRLHQRHGIAAQGRAARPTTPSSGNT